MKLESTEITQELISEAKKNPAQWIKQLGKGIKKEGRYIYPENVIGSWYADANGELTGEFKPNDDYVPYKVAVREPREYMMRVMPANIDDREEWCPEVDPKYDDLFPKFPPEGIIGDWYVGPDGHYTGHFRPNPLYKGNIKT